MMRGKNETLILSIGKEGMMTQIINEERRNTGKQRRGRENTHKLLLPRVFEPRAHPNQWGSANHLQLVRKWIHSAEPLGQGLFFDSPIKRVGGGETCKLVKKPRPILELFEPNWQQANII